MRLDLPNYAKRHELLQHIALCQLPPDEHLLFEPEASIFTGWSRRSLQRGRMTGEGPPYVVLGKRRIAYRRSDLVSWMKSRVVSSTSEATRKSKHA